ncbi:MAG TPA: histone deacetylase, partial [Desulfurivibrionaceae bacterium]|nr:histone deacetylase [Desulfurivibrionaceae bacterium]
MTRRTAVFKHELFLEHDPGYGHVESPDRLRVIYQALDGAVIRSRLLFPDFGPASEEVLALNHTPDHIRRVKATAGKPFEALDPDTHTSPRSWEAASLAAGAVVQALTMVVRGECDNACALVRPPGHHAEADHTSGFCLFNNVAVAARYGLTHLGLQRILVVDWDIHHGNGTQHSFYDTDQVLYFSTHQYPYFPGSGALGETGRGKGEGYTVNVPLQGGQDDLAFARIFNELLVPVAREYQPECIIISAGYDIYVGDPLGTMGVTPAGFGYLTKVLVELADELCNGRVVLALEGGYSFEGLA